jgi:hypothetical protein
MPISRRTFLALSGFAAGASAVDVTALALPDGYIPGSQLYWPSDRALPVFPQAFHLDAVDLTALDGDQQGLLVSLQGIVNRKQPRLYFHWGADPTNLEWLKTFRVPSKISSDPWALFEKYRNEVRGAIIFDPNVPDTINLATTLAGLHGAVIATAALAAAHNLPVIEDLRGRFTDKFAVCNYALSDVWPKVTKRMVTAIGPSTTRQVSSSRAPIMTPVARSLRETPGLVMSGWLAILTDLVTPTASTIT